MVDDDDATTCSSCDDDVAAFYSCAFVDPRSWPLRCMCPSCFVEKYLDDRTEIEFLNSYRQVSIDGLLQIREATRILAEAARLPPSAPRPFWARLFGGR